MLVVIDKFPDLVTHLIKYQGFIFSLATDYYPAELSIACDRAFRKNLCLTRSPAYNDPNNTTIFLSVFRTAISATCGLCSSRSHSTENCTEIKTEIPCQFIKAEPGLEQNNVRASQPTTPAGRPGKILLWLE